ncbi:hypothetical protein XFF6991_4922 [Xanthomonas phaseoli pv. phaseoli]|uniref:Uncharacterized protein n=1 Tax=Xanthomonas campestris pv. phaseoli TaxID=317013 RepID=A0A7Z7IXH7_XANCH|nr:hypothetical protein XFF6991_4922 [Xanthomonas phaseoli pv. phaseoli]
MYYKMHNSYQLCFLYLNQLLTLYYVDLIEKHYLN